MRSCVALLLVPLCLAQGLFIATQCSVVGQSPSDHESRAHLHPFGSCPTDHAPAEAEQETDRPLAAAADRFDARHDDSGAMIVLPEFSSELRRGGCELSAVGGEQDGSAAEVTSRDTVGLGPNHSLARLPQVLPRPIEAVPLRQRNRVLRI